MIQYPKTTIFWSLMLVVTVWVVVPGFVAWWRDTPDARDMLDVRSIFLKDARTGICVRLVEGGGAWLRVDPIFCLPPLKDE
jgi:hypothetical protein